MMYYIGKRSNPQLLRVYYRALGELTPCEVKTAEAPPHGTQTLTGYKTLEEHAQACSTLEENGERVVF